MSQEKTALPQMSDYHDHVSRTEISLPPTFNFAHISLLTPLCYPFPSKNIIRLPPDI